MGVIAVEGKVITKQDPKEPEANDRQLGSSANVAPAITLLSLLH